MVSTNALLASQNMLALLEKANHHTETILDELPSIFAIITEEGEIIRANQACCSLIGESTDSVLKKNLISALDQENQATFHYFFNKIKTEKLTREVNFRADIHPPISHKTKKIIWNISTPSKNQRTKNRFDNDAYKALYYITGEDCSSIYDSETKLLGIFECLPLGIIMLDNSGHIEEVLTHHTSVIIGKSSLKNKHISDVFSSLHPSTIESPTSNSSTASSIVHSYGEKNDFSDLISCINQPLIFFNKIEKKIKNTFNLKSEDKNHKSKWIRLHYQPIVKNNVIEKFMIIIKDDTESVTLQNEKKRINEIERHSKALYESAIRDPLTGLYTRLYMEDGFNMLLNGFDFGSINAIDLVIFDIDDFKTINDSYGHTIGDHAISIVGKQILSHSISGSIAIRYGGDEFLVMLPKENTHEPAGKHFAEKVKCGVENIKFGVNLNNNHISKIDEKQTLTSISLSGGVISCQKGENIMALIARADQYLYQAKKLGKNRINCEYDYTKNITV